MERTMANQRTRAHLSWRLHSAWNAGAGDRCSDFQAKPEPCISKVESPYHYMLIINLINISILIYSYPKEPVSR